MAEAPAPLQFGNRALSYHLPEGVVWPVAGRPFTAETLQPIIDLFLDTPYLWGGKSVFGTDCSGFVQQVLKLFGVKLLRDAYLQAEQGVAVGSLNEAAFGDLLFFQNEMGG
jgi:cell wall-associated NlpC family hydrolase